MENDTTKPSEMNYDVKPNTEGEGNTSAETAVPHSNFPKINKKNVLLSLGLFIVVVALSIAFLFLIFRSSVDKDQPVATVGEKTIYQSDITKEYNTRYPNEIVEEFNQIDEQIQSEIKKSLIENAIIEKIASSLNITTTTEELNNELLQKKADGIPEDILNQEATQKGIENSLLKSKIQTKVVAWREIEVARIFIPEVSNFQTLIDNAKRLLEEMRSDVQSGLSFSEAYALAKSKPYFNSGLDTRVERVEENSSIDPQLKNLVFSADVGDVTSVIDTGSGSLEFAKVIAKSEGNFKSFDQWLESEKQKVIIQ